MSVRFDAGSHSPTLLSATPSEAAARTGPSRGPARERAWIAGEPEHRRFFADRHTGGPGPGAGDRPAGPAGPPAPPVRGYRPAPADGRGSGRLARSIVLVAGATVILAAVLADFRSRTGDAPQADRARAPQGASAPLTAAALKTDAAERQAGSLARKTSAPAGNPAIAASIGTSAHDIRTVIGDWPDSTARSGAFTAFIEDAAADEEPPPGTPRQAAAAPDMPAAAAERSAPATGLDSVLAAIDGAVAREAVRIDETIARARARLEAGDLDAAGTAARDVLGFDPGNLAALRLYGQVLLRQRRFAPAVEILSTTIEADRDDADARLGLATALLALGRPEDAIAAAEPVGAGSIDALDLLSRANAARGSLAEAAGGCDLIGSEYGLATRMDWCHAAVHNQSGNNFEAVQKFIAVLHGGDAPFIRTKQALLRDAGYFDGPIDGISDQRLIDAVTACAVARDCIL